MPEFHMTRTATSAADRARSCILARYQNFEGMDGDTETILLHILADLIDLCDADDIDLDITLDQAREFCRQSAT